VSVGRLLHLALVLGLFTAAVTVAAAACWVAVTDRREQRRAERSQVITRAHVSAALTTAAASVVASL
jgi:hypothetical protein